MDPRRSLTVGRFKLEDWLRTKNAAGLGSLALLAASARATADVKLARLIAVATYFPRTDLARRAMRIAGRHAAENVKTAPTSGVASLERSVILKPFVSEREPGFLAVSFEHELMKLVRLSSFSRLERQYRIVFLPTWQPFYSVALSLLDARSTQPYFLMPSAFSERDLCGEFSQKCTFLPFHAASWVRAALYPASSQKKTIDLLMVANFSRHKRHWRLLEALSQMPREIRAVFAGVPLSGRTAASLYEEARLFGVEDRTEIIESPPDESLRDLLRAARLLCAMTHKEGSYIAVAEALMAGTPVAMFSNAKIGTKAYINDETGFLLSPRKRLAPQLMRALDNAEVFQPQTWAKENISAEVNSVSLNKLLRQWSIEQDLEWTLETEPVYSRHFEFLYLRDDAEPDLAGEYRRLRREFGLGVARPAA
jgi:glycosyltransferase involved in cell wall biosynthesis